MANVLEKDLIIIRSVYGKVGQRVYTNPCKDPRTGRYPAHVKMINSKGDLLLTDEERNSGQIFIAVNKQFVLEDGTTFDITDPQQAADWYAIQHCPLIAFSRDSVDTNGNYIIDGTTTRYGIAELYVERPGYESVKKINKKKLIHQAESYIYDDPNGVDGRVLKAKLLGRNMTKAPDADVTDYLLEIAGKTPNKIIELYTGTDTSLRLLFLDAKEKGIIYIKNKVYLYSDQQIVLGASDDAVISWMKNPNNSRILKLIQADVLGDLMQERQVINKKEYDSDEEIKERVKQAIASLSPEDIKALFADDSKTTDSEKSNTSANQIPDAESTARGKKK